MHRHLIQRATGQKPLAWTANHPLISTTVLWVCKTFSIIWSTTLWARLQFFPVFLEVYIKEEFGNMTKYQQTYSRTHKHTHTQRAIITLLHHTRKSSGKPKEAEAERGVNRKPVTRILVAALTYNERDRAKSAAFTHMKWEETVCLSVVTE